MYAIKSTKQLFDGILFNVRSDNEIHPYSIEIQSKIAKKYYYKTEIFEGVFVFLIVSLKSKL